jgi:hypothetical protein
VVVVVVVVVAVILPIVFHLDHLAFPLRPLARVRKSLIAETKTSKMRHNASEGIKIYSIILFLKASDVSDCVISSYDLNKLEKLSPANFSSKRSCIDFERHAKDVPHKYFFDEKCHLQFSFPESHDASLVTVSVTDNQELHMGYTAPVSRHVYKKNFTNLQCVHTSCKVLSDRLQV